MRWSWQAAKSIFEGKLIEIVSEPDNQFDAYLSHPDCKAVLCDVHVWMPHGNHTDIRIDIFAPICTYLHLIVALHPLTESSTARDYLALLSAFEGLVSCDNKTDGSISSGDWKRVEKYLGCFIDRSKSINSQSKVLIKQKLPELKRESLEGKMIRFFDDKAIYLADLWPLFDKERSSLTEIRNRLAHGDGFNNANYDVLTAAREHISVLLERVVIRCLGGNVSKTSAGSSSA